MNFRGAVKNQQEFEADKTAISVRRAVNAVAMFYSTNQGKTAAAPVLHFAKSR